MRPVPSAKHIVVVETSGEIEANRVSFDIRPTRDNVVLGTYHRAVGDVGKRYKPFCHMQSWRTLRAFLQEGSNYVNVAAGLNRDRIPDSESQQRDDIERGSFADVHVMFLNAGDYSRIVQGGDYGVPNDSNPGTLIDFKGICRVFCRSLGQFVRFKCRLPLFISDATIEEDRKQSQPFSGKLPPISALLAPIGGLYISYRGIREINFRDQYVRGFILILFSVVPLFWATYRLLDWSIRF